MAFYMYFEIKSKKIHLYFEIPIHMANFYLNKKNQIFRVVLCP